MEEIKYVNGKYIPLTEAELASLKQPISDWTHLQFQHRIKAPIALGRAHPDLIAWATLNPDAMVIEKVGDEAHIYYNELDEKDTGLIEAYNLTIENRE